MIRILFPQVFSGMVVAMNIQEGPRSKEDKMCMHRFCVAPDAAAQPGYLPSYRNGSSPAIQGAVECKVESQKMPVRNFKMQGLDDGNKSVSGNPTVEYRH